MLNRRGLLKGLFGGAVAGAATDKNEWKEWIERETAFHLETELRKIDGCACSGVLPEPDFTYQAASGVILPLDDSIR